ncbi:MAG: 16S rRNA (cytosine(1402)-N(4))-methyltransferase RsmH [Lachnospiraceae bacterium]|nr:16S rRNA (cytosine(1402)-N(4))-methyltransferase RsmH [Lachnospiraceae bacterium]
MSNKQPQQALHFEQKTQEEKHVRRPHYSGRYPKRFEEKYKERNPEKYQDEIQHVIEKGNTPAGMHIPIMVAETLEKLQIQPGMKGLDCTLGYGGHTTAFLEALKGQGHLISTDIDPIEIKKTTARLRGQGFGEDLWTPVHASYVEVDRLAKEYGPFNFVMADLGVSSMQIDDPSRGFSWRADGPLDLRFDPEKGEPASERLRQLTREELTELLFENSDEPYAREIAQAIIKTYRSAKEINTTFDLRNLIEKTLLSVKEVGTLSQEEQREIVKKSCARVFQALRIEVNSEFETLMEFIKKLPYALAPGGRVVILTFHSGEDRIVKKLLKEELREGLWSEIADSVIRPGKEECYRNPRAHSTKLRWAIR